MVHSQTPETSTLPAASTPVYAEPQLTEELLERFDSFAPLRFLPKEVSPPRRRLGIL